MRLLALMSLGDAPAPMPVTVVSQPVTPMTVAAALAPVQAAPASPVAPVGVRQDYIVQAESAEVARGAVLRGDRIGIRTATITSWPSSRPRPVRMAAACLAG
jgi:hypothetical protein